MFKELLKDLVGEEISLIKTKSVNDWQEVLVEEIRDFLSKIKVEDKK